MERIPNAKQLLAEAKLGYSSSKERLLSWLHDDPEWRIRDTIAKTIGCFGDATFLPELEKSLQKEISPAVRAQAVRSIGLLAPAEYLPRIEYFLAIDPSSSVQRELFAAAYRLGDRTKLKPLLHLLEEADAKAAWGILFTIQYLIACRPPTFLHTDSTAIQEAVTKFIDRLPAFSIATKPLLRRLAKLEANNQL